MKDCLAKDYWTTKKDHWTTEILFDERLIGRPTKILISKDWRERLLGDMTIGERLVGERRLGERLYWAINWDYWTKFGKTIGRKIIWTTKKNFVRKWKDHIQKTTWATKCFYERHLGEGCSRERLFGNKRRHGFSRWNFVAIVHTSWVKCHVISCSVISCVRWDTRACVLRAIILDFWLTVTSNSVTQKTLFLSPNSLSPEGPSPNCF